MKILLEAEIQEESLKENECGTVHFPLSGLTEETGSISNERHR